MTTVRDVATGALRLIQVIGPRDPVIADDMDICVERLNDMMASWRLRSVDVGHYPLEENMTFPLDEAHVRGVKALLAIEIAPDFGVGIPDTVRVMANDGWQSLQAAYMDFPEATFDTQLTRMPSQRRA